MPTRMLALQSDARLLELYRRGDQRAFEVIVRRYRRELLAYCKRLGLSDARAEDALQQALLNAWVSLQRGTEIRELHAWLRRIVHNTALNLMRGAPEDRAVDLDSELVDVASAADSSLAKRMAAKEALADVAALPPMQRDAIVLSAIEGRSHAEVAGALGVSQVAVRGLLYRARATLRAGAGALTPAPLLSWLSQAASRLPGGTGLASDPSVAGEGFNLGRALLEGAAVLATAAVAAGAVLGHAHTHRRALDQAPRAVAQVTASGKPSLQVAPSQRRPSSRGDQKPSGSTRARVVRASGGVVRRTSAQTKSGPASQPVGPSGAANPGTTPKPAGSAESTHPIAGTASGSSGGGETPVQSEPPAHSETPEQKEVPERGDPEGPGSGDESERAREAEEELAERRTELQEREAEHERELAESEAEKAREAREEETDH